VTRKELDALLPILHFLNLIEEQIDLAVDLSSSPDNLIMQSLRVLQMGICIFSKVNRDELRRTNAGLRKLLFNQFQHDRFSATSNAGQDF